MLTCFWGSFAIIHTPCRSRCGWSPRWWRPRRWVRRIRVSTRHTGPHAHCGRTALWSSAQRLGSRTSGSLGGEHAPKHVRQACVGARFVLQGEVYSCRWTGVSIEILGPMKPYHIGPQSRQIFQVFTKFFRAPVTLRPLELSSPSFIHSDCSGSKQ